MSFCFFPSNYKLKQTPDPPKNAILQNSKPFASFTTVSTSTKTLQKQPKRVQSQTRKQNKESPTLMLKKSIDMKESNALDVDKTIRNNFQIEKASLGSLREKLKGVDKIKFPSNEEKKDYINSLRRKIKDIETSASFLLYTFKSSDILEEIKKAKSVSSTKSFISIQETESTAREITLTLKFINIAQLYINVESIAQTPKKLCCRNCGSNNLRLSVEDESFYVCRVCFVEREILDDAPSFKDTDRVNMTSKYTYTRRGHFNDAVKKFQGTQNTDPKKIRHVVDVLVKEIEKHNLTTTQHLKNSVSKDHIYTFLSEQDLSCHYDDVNLLFRAITGEPCPDLSQIIENLYEDFDKLEEVLGQIKDENRSNSLTVNYKLYKLLQRWRYPCRKSDFYILKTKTKEDEHDEKMKEAFEKLEWEWIPTY